MLELKIEQLGPERVKILQGGSWGHGPIPGMRDYLNWLKTADTPDRLGCSQEVIGMLLHFGPRVGSFRLTSDQQGAMEEVIHLLMARQQQQIAMMQQHSTQALLMHLTESQWKQQEAPFVT